MKSWQFTEVRFSSQGKQKCAFVVKYQLSYYQTFLKGWRTSMEAGKKSWPGNLKRTKWWCHCCWSWSINSSEDEPETRETAVGSWGGGSSWSVRLWKNFPVDNSYQHVKWILIWAIFMIIIFHAFIRAIHSFFHEYQNTIAQQGGIRFLILLISSWITLISVSFM